MKISKSLLPLAALAAVMAGCQDEDFGATSQEVRNAKYAQEFVKKFGEANPDQDWSVATLVTANVNLPQITGTSKMCVLTGDPRAKASRLLYQAVLQNGQAAFSFDALEGSDHVFVTIEQNGVYRVFGKFVVVNGVVNVGGVAAEQFSEPLTRAFSGTCPTTQRTDDDATRVYTYFNNTKSTNVIKGIKYPGDASYENDDNVKTLEGWVAYAKANVSWANNTLTNYSPFTDESIASFVKVTGSDFSTLAVDGMKASVTYNTSEVIVWDVPAWSQHYVKTLEEWISAVTSAYQGPDNYQYSNDGYPFLPSYIANYTENDWSKFDWSNPQYKDGAEVLPAGSLITYNGTSRPLAGWQADAAANIDKILDGSYDGPWPNETLKNCITKSPCSMSDDGAIYDGLTDESTWDLKENTKVVYDNVYPTFQYLSNVEKSAAPGMSLITNNSFFGDGNMFAEGVAVWDGSKLGKYYTEEEMRKMENGYSIVTTEGQVIELPFVFGCTAYTNQFGYIYYKESEEDKIDPIALKHYVLIDDARPAKNIYRDEWGTGTPVNGDGNGSVSDEYYSYDMEDSNGNKFTGNWNGLSAAKDDDFVCTCNEPGHTGIYSESGQHLSTCYSPAERYALVANKQIMGTTYRPMFFGEDGNTAQGTYEWPAGYKIVFWINTLATSNGNDDLPVNHPASCFTASGNMGGHFNYSLASINKRLFHNYQGDLEHSDAELETLGQVQCISWTIDGTHFLAFGDVSGDRDLNDMVFIVSAPNSDPNNTVVAVPVKWHLNFNSQHEEDDLFDNYSLNIGADYTNPKNSEGGNSEPKRPGYIFKGWSLRDPTAEDGESDITGHIDDETAIHYYAIWEPENPVPADPISWIFACEDLGGVFDYDFNDVVWEVRKNYDENGENPFVEVRLLAAGGTLPFQLNYNGQKILTKEDVCGEGKSGDVFETLSCEWKKVCDVDDTWTLTGNSSLFVINVKNGDNEIISNITTSYTKDKENKDNNTNTPQVLILPSDWAWPTEGTPIDEAYPNFTEWAKDGEPVKWNTPVSGKTVSR